MMTNKPVATICVDDPEKAALSFSAILAVDNGVASSLKPNAHGGYDVVADDGQWVAFYQGGQS